MYDVCLMFKKRHAKLNHAFSVHSMIQALILKEDFCRVGRDKRLSLEESRGVEALPDLLHHLHTQSLEADRYSFCCDDLHGQQSFLTSHCHKMPVGSPNSLNYFILDSRSLLSFL